MTFRDAAIASAQSVLGDSSMAEVVIDELIEDGIIVLPSDPPPPPCPHSWGGRCGCPDERHTP